MVKGTIWLTLAFALRSAGQGALLVVLAQLAGAEVTGRYSLALAITAPIFVLFEFGLRTVYLTHRGNYRFKYYVQIRVLTLALATVTSISVAAFFNQEITAIVTLMALLRSADSFGELYSAPMQRHGALALIVRAYSANAILTVLVAILLIQLNASLPILLWGLIAVSTSTTLFLLVRPTNKITRANEKPTGAFIQTKHSNAIVRAGLPTGVSWGLLSLLSSIPQYFLAAYFGEIQVGIFAIILYIVVVVEVFLNALSQTWIPQAKKEYLNKNDFFRYTLVTSLRWCAAFLPLAFVTGALAIPILPFVFGTTYTVGIPEMLPISISIAILPLVFFSAMSLNVINRYGFSLIVSTLSAIITIAFCALFITQYGVIAALWANTVGLGCRGALNTLALRYATTRNQPDFPTDPSSAA